MALSRPCSTRPRPLGRSLGVVWVVALLALAGTASSLPPQGEDRPHSTFRDVIDVSIVNLDVHVTDKKGRPITGLERGDFEIREDSRLVEITNFVAVEGSLGGSGAAFAEPLYLVLYLDNLLLEPAHRSRVLGDISTFLGREFPPETEFMLATNDTKLDVVLQSTANVGELLSALDNLDDEATGIRDVLDRRRASSSIANIYESCDNVPLCDPCRDVWENGSDLAADVLRYGQPVDAGQPLVDMDEAEVGVEVAEADRRIQVQPLQLSQWARLIAIRHGAASGPEDFPNGLIVQV